MRHSVSGPKGARRGMRRYILVKVEIRQEDGQYAAYCPDLGTASCGDTIEEASKNMEEAVLVHLSALEELGEREDFFRRHNIKFHYKDDPKPVRSRRFTSRPAVYTTTQAIYA
jgi:predicted RNase H-like HicB family nuclease